MSNSTHDGSDGVILYRILTNGNTASEAFYESIRKQIEARIPVLSKDDEPYTARDLCGEKFWIALGDPILAGSCVADMADNKVLPLVRVPGKHEYPFLYRIL
jgi:hypothetical protein